MINSIFKLNYFEYIMLIHISQYFSCYLNFNLHIFPDSKSDIITFLLYIYIVFRLSL